MKTRLVVALVLLIGLAGYFRTAKDSARVHSAGPQLANGTVPAMPESASRRSEPAIAADPSPSANRKRVTPREEVVVIPPSAGRPTVCVQLAHDGTLAAVSRRVAPVMQARHVEISDGYYYRITSATGELLFDGSVPTPMLRSQENGIDKNGMTYVTCHETPDSRPVGFALPNTEGRLQVFPTKRGDSFAAIAQTTPLVDVALKPL